MTDDGGDADGAAFPPARQAWYAVFILTIASVSSNIDRQIMSLLVGPIERDLGISDTQMSLLLGISFAIFYTILGFPIGRLADTRSRRAIMGWGIAAWSVMTAACGLARNYGQLLLARVGVGVGEASLGPPSLSFLADSFPRERMATAASVFGVGVFLGSGAAYLIGGQVVDAVSGPGAWTLPLLGSIRPWQTVFLVVGLPGVLIALLMLTVREPRRRGATRSGKAVPIGEIVTYLRAHAGTFVSHTFGYSLFVMVNYGTAAWLPSYLGRVHGWAPGRIGLYMGGATMTFGVLGIILGGRAADAMLRRGMSDAKLRVGVIAAAGALASAIPLYLVRTDAWVIALLVPLNVFSAFPFGAAQAGLQEMTPSAMRAQVTALWLFVSNLVGFTLGPTAVAAATDFLFRSEGAVGSSILLVAAVGLSLAMVLLWWGGRGYAVTVAASEQWDRERAVAL
jgi:MFS family permease